MEPEIKIPWRGLFLVYGVYYAATGLALVLGFLKDHGAFQ